MIAWAILREARARAALTQRELAARAKKPQSEIARIERGRRDPSLTTLQRLVRAAGFDLRIELVPHDPHDDRLIDAALDLTPSDRLARLEQASALYASARVLDSADS